MIGSGALTLAVVLLGATSTGSPPNLPTPTGERCVPASPVTSSVEPWALRRMAPASIWPLTRGQGITVAVLDTGVSAAAPALAGAVLPGRDVVSSGAADSDCAGRGTALAGIVAARPQTGSGVFGMAPAVRVLPIRITDDSNRVTVEALTKGVREADDRHAGVILLGTGVESGSAALRAAVRRAVAGGAVVVAPVEGKAGDGLGDPPIWYPAAYPDVLAVNGAALDGTVAPAPATAGADLVAPAAAALSIAPTGPGHYAVSGNAVAAAYVAGTVALVRAYRPGLGPAEVRDRLERLAEPVVGGPDPAQGAGPVDAYAAVAAATAARSPVVAPVTGPVRLTAPPRTPLRIRVAGWTASGLLLAGAFVLGVRAGRRTRAGARRARLVRG